MPINIGANTVGGIFAANSFRVPHYQRAYAWTEEPHLRDFLDDLRSHPAASKRPYYLGTVLLTRSESQPHARLTQYDVVDGQQRLTTITIFAASVLRRLAADPARNDTVEEFTDGLLFSRGKQRLFKTVEEDDPFFERFITGAENATANDCITPSQKRLAAAKRYFDIETGKIPTAQLEALLDRLFKSTILIYAVESTIEATQIFEFQNDRGKRLTNLEALKSYLMHGLYLHGGENTENDLHYVQSQFARLYRTAEAIEGEVLAPSEDQLLGYHCAAYLPHIMLNDEEGWRKPKELIRHILASPAHLGAYGPTDFIRRFSDQLADSYGDALKVLQARVGAAPVAGLFVLGRTAIFWPVLLKAWRLGQPSMPHDFDRVARAMERFASVSSLAGVRADTGESKLRGIANRFSGDFAELIAEIDRMRTDWNIPARLATALDDPDFYHGGRTARYVLWKYENHLRSQPGSREQLLSWKELVQDKSTPEQYGLDHILAQEGDEIVLNALTRWNPKSADEIARPFREIFLHRLGNLVLDTRSTGASKGTKHFRDRADNYSRSTFVSQKEIVTKFASKLPDGSLDWDEQAIRTRHSVMRSFALTQL